MNPTQKGNRGEELALRWLRAHGYTPVVTNWRSGKYEIDIIAQTAENLVFVEVKLRALDTLTRPMQAVTKGKKGRIMAAANRFLEDHPTPLVSRGLMCWRCGIPGRNPRLRTGRMCFSREGGRGKG